MTVELKGALKQHAETTGLQIHGPTLIKGGIPGGVRRENDFACEQFAEPVAGSITRVVF